MLRRSDRYVLREMIGPFALALAGLILFILLNIILSLSDLMVDRGVTMATLLRIVLLKVPSLLVVAIPMSVLFATFLGLGRMVHDREVVALESLGIPLRRVLLPLVIAAGLVAAADFAVYNWLVPASEGAYQDALRGVIYRQGVPRITSNAFFRGPNDQFLYIRRYDEATGKIHDVHIYDTSGELFPQAQVEKQAQLVLLTANEGLWEGNSWALTDAHVYGFDRDGVLVFSAVVGSLVLPVDQGIAAILSRSQTTSEMGIAELLTRISQARANGQRVNEYVVEMHLKMALPLASVIFVLVGGSLSLAFLPRSRAVGIVLGLLLVAIFQGVLWWTQTLGRRGAMDPALAAWLPDLLFGGFGLLLFLRVDRLASRDVWSRVRARLPFLAITFGILATLSLSACATPPIHLDCDELFVSPDGKLLRASGSVHAAFESTSVEAGSLVLEEVQSGSWTLAAANGVSLRTSDELALESETLAATVDAATGALVALAAEATFLSGSIAFTNSDGEKATLYFRADRARLTLGEGRMELLEGYGSELTTCACCGTSLRERPYSLRAERLLLYPDRLFVAYGITGRAAGAGIVWLPVYMQPLKETLEAPLFPAIGRSATHGWFAKWSLPFFASEALYGHVDIDVYPWTRELAVGGGVRYDVGGQRGELTAFRFPAKVGDPETSVRFRHTSDLAAGWQAAGSADYKAVGTRERSTYSFHLDGTTKLGDVALTASRTLTETEGEATRVDERLPELSFDAAEVSWGRLSLSPSLAFGWRREGVMGEPLAEALRLGGGLAATAAAFEVAGMRITPAGSIRATLYDGPSGREEQVVLALTPSASLGNLSLEWSSAWAFGSSPFDSDRATTEHAVRWAYSRQGPLDLTLRGSFDFTDGLGPESATLAWTAVADWKIAGTFDPQDARVTSFEVSAIWSDGVRSATWILPLDKAVGRFRQSTLRLSSAIDPVSLSLRLVADLDLLTLSSWAIETELASGAGWGLNASASHTAASPRSVAIELGLFKDIADCLRVGVEFSQREAWLYISILAFPEAVLRYAPRTLEVEVGT